VHKDKRVLQFHQHFKEENEHKLHLCIQFLVINVRLGYKNNQLMLYMETNHYMFWVP
jgi:hypothetical protein